MHECIIAVSRVHVNRPSAAISYCPDLMRATLSADLEGPRTDCRR